MIQNVISQPQEFLFATFIGVLLGIMFEITNLGKLGKKHKILPVVIFDSVFSVAAIFIYVVLNMSFINLKITFYSVIGNVIGFIICRKSIAILLAKFYKMLYNLYKRIGRKKHGEESR